MLQNIQFQINAVFVTIEQRILKKNYNLHK